jgi:hypothetical protein
MVLLGKPEVKITSGRPRRRWEDRIRMGFWRLAGGMWSGFNWPVAGCCKCGDEPSGSGISYDKLNHMVQYVASFRLLWTR